MSSYAQHPHSLASSASLCPLAPTVCVPPARGGRWGCGNAIPITDLTTSRVVIIEAYHHHQVVRNNCTTTTTTSTFLFLIRTARGEMDWGHFPHEVVATFNAFGWRWGFLVFGLRSSWVLIVILHVCKIYEIVQHSWAVAAQA